MTDPGDRPASLELALAEFDGFIIGIAGDFARHTPWRVEPEDLVQEARIALLEAYDSYSPDHGAKFITYLGNTVKFRLKDYLRRDIDHLTRHMRDTISEEELDMPRWRDPVPVDWQDVDYLSVQAIEQIELNQRAIDSYTIGRFASWLHEQGVSDNYLVVLALYLDDFNMMQIGQVLGVSESRVSQMFKRLTDLAHIFGVSRGFRSSTAESHA